MAHSTTMKALLGALGLAGLVACGGPDQNTPPKAPESNTTSITGGTQAVPSSMGTSPQTTSGQEMNAPPPEQTTPEPTPATTTPSTSIGSSTASPSGATSTLSDAQIAAVIEAANKGEIEQAKTALKKSKNARVRQFAQHMETDHTNATNEEKTVDQKGGITPLSNEVSDRIANSGDRVMSKLNSASGDTFDKDYIDAQIDEHQKLLDTIDNKLMPQAQNADLKSFLEKVRAKVSRHLTMAQDVQSSLSH